MQQSRQLRPLEEGEIPRMTNPIRSKLVPTLLVSVMPLVYTGICLFPALLHLCLHGLQHSCSCSCMDSASCAARCLSGNTAVALCLKGGSFEGPYRSQPHGTVGCAADDSARFSPLTLLPSSLLLLRLLLLQVCIYYPSYPMSPATTALPLQMESHKQYF